MNRVDRSTAHRPEPTGLRWIATAVLRTWAGSLAEAWSNRRGFCVQVWAMVANDAVWVLFWLFLFRRFESIRGWEVQDIVVLQAVPTTAGGFVLGLLANSRLIGQAIADGRLDAALGLPIPTLPYLLARRIDVTFIGDIIFGVGLFFILADPTPIRLAIFVTTAVASAAMIVGFLVLIGSTAFFLGRSEVGDLSFQALLLFASYPVDLFGSRARFLLYAVIPAGFVSGVPVRLLSNFDWRWAVAMAAVATGLMTAAVVVFNRGLRQYTSGSVWTGA
ncbi:MAG: ABC-2 family transporter protein [Acidimicrobiia bacterium]|nr:ABC-2 family transporter protein [Acidimicrobiia bacterium]